MSLNTSNSKFKGKFLEFTKWFLVSFIALLIGSYLVNKLAIGNSFAVNFLTALFISIVVQAFRSHNHEDFSLRWFIFYLLVYSTIIWVVNSYIFTETVIQKSIFLSFITSLFIGGTIMLIEKAKLRYKTLPWISFVLLLLLVIGNLGNLGQITKITLSYQNQNNPTIISEDKLSCPSTTESLPLRELSTLALNTLISTDVWRIEKNFDNCYSGKYKGQYPERLYCDNMIVSRWDKSVSGSINYRWYTAVTTEWSVESSQGRPIYVLNGMSCENGKKVTVDKETRNYYVYVARDGSEIKIEY